MRSFLRIPLAGILFLCVHAIGWSQDAATNRISLWNGKAPKGNDLFEDADAWISPHLAKPGNGTAVIICPGGGYGNLVRGPEGHGIAKWLNQHQISGFVLEYRLPAGRSHVPLWDAQRAIRVIRAQANEWGVDSKRVGIMGFSAGGHLASTLGTHFDKGNPNATDSIDRQSCRPDFLTLVYPVISMGDATHSGSRRNLLGPEPSPALIDLFSNEKQVTSDTPPTFLAHAVDDQPVPIAHSRLFHQALQKHQVPVTLLELPSGGHGLNGYSGPMWDAWQKQCIDWLAKL